MASTLPSPESLVHRGPDSRVDGATRPPTDGPAARTADSSGEAATSSETKKPAELGLELFKTAYDRLNRHAGTTLGGGLAFGALLSIAPLAIVVIALASAFLGEGGARTETLALVRDNLGTGAEPVVAEWIDQARGWSTGATVLGIVLFFLGSARLVGLVDEAFEVIFEVPPRREETTMEAVKRWASSQLWAVVVTFTAGLLMSASLVMRTWGTYLFSGMQDHPVIAVVTWVGQEIISLAVWTGALALIYRVLPPVRLSRHDVLRGALVSALLLEAALLILRGLAGVLELGAAYGAAGAIIATLLTLHIAGQLFLYGAEVTAELADRRDGPGSDRLTPARAACSPVRPGARDRATLGVASLLHRPGNAAESALGTASGRGTPLAEPLGDGPRDDRSTLRTPGHGHPA